MSQRPRIYLDHAATTPILPAAKAAMMEAMERWANPSSPHAEGRAARAALEDSRARIKRALGWDGELIFTSGATEAIEIAMRRAKGGKRFISAVEHDAVFRAAPDAAILPMGSEFHLDLNRLEEKLRGHDRPIVAVQTRNSETGDVQQMGDIAPVVKAAGGVLISDCAQSAGQVPIGAQDISIVSAHKLGGPPGIGALLVSEPGVLEAIGGQERGYRSGTENLPAILAFAAALEARRSELFDARLCLMLADLDEAFIKAGGGHVGYCAGTSHICAFAMPHLSARVQLIQFDARGFAVSAGSACSSGSLKPSRTLTGFGVPEDVAERTIRVSIGWTTTVEELEAFGAAWLEIAEDAEKRAA